MTALVKTIRWMSGARVSSAMWSRRRRSLPGLAAGRDHEICAQVTESQQLTLATGVTEIEQPQTLPAQLSPNRCRSPRSSQTQPDICPPGTTFDYTVRHGDTMDKIAKLRREHEPGDPGQPGIAESQYDLSPVR